MRGLENIIPLDLLLMMEPEELGAKLLFFLRNKKNAPYHFGNEISSLWANSNLPGQTSPYPQQKRSEINLAISEAWAWLVAQGLLVANPDSHGNEWMVLSRRASKFEDESEVASFMIARLLPKEALHRSITKQVWGAFMRGEFDSAVFQAMKAVEVAVHEAVGKPENLRGTDLMRKAFHAETGQLTDPNVEKGERDAMAALFAGAIGTFKNPHSHRNVSLEDPLQAVEIIMTANHLLRIVDDRKS